jgi:hypothetical protein
VVVGWEVRRDFPTTSAFEAGNRPGPVKVIVCSLSWQPRAAHIGLLYRRLGFPRKANIRWKGLCNIVVKKHSKREAGIL